MANIITRYDIQATTEKDQLNLDFILDSTDKKVIRGTVWNSDLSNPARVPDALVQIYKPGKDYQNNPHDIINIGCVITDISGEFFAGPFDANAIIIFKIFKLNDNRSGNMENSFKTDGDNTEKPEEK